MTIQIKCFAVLATNAEGAQHPHIVLLHTVRRSRSAARRAFAALMRAEPDVPRTLVDVVPFTLAAREISK